MHTALLKRMPTTMQLLRVQAFFHKTFQVYHIYTFQVYHVYYNFILGYICRITANFGTLKVGSLLKNIFASNNCFSDKNIFQNGFDALSKIDDAYLTKSWTFHLVRIIWYCSNFATMWYKHLLWNSRCFCKETPSTPGWNHDIFYPCFTGISKVVFLPVTYAFHASICCVEFAHS